LHRGVSGHVEIYQCVVHNKQALKATASKMSNLRLSKYYEVRLSLYSTNTIMPSLLGRTKPLTRPHVAAGRGLDRAGLNFRRRSTSIFSRQIPKKSSIQDLANEIFSLFHTV